MISTARNWFDTLQSAEGGDESPVLNDLPTFWREMARHFGPSESRLQMELRLFAYRQDDRSAVDYTEGF